MVDIGLPVMNGYELARRLLELNRQVDLIALTGFGQESDRQRALAAGFRKHMVKPIDLDALEKALISLERERCVEAKRG